MSFNTLTQPPYSQPTCSALESKYSALLDERLDWCILVSYIVYRNEPVTCCFNFRESFNAKLVRRIIADKYKRAESLSGLAELIVMEAMN